MNTTLWPATIQQRITITVLGLFLFGVLGFSLLASQMLLNDLENLLASQQQSSADTLVTRLDNDLQERITALQRFSIQLADDSTLHDTALLQNILDNRVLLHTFFNSGLIVMDTRAVAQADSPIVPGRQGTDYSDRPFIRALVREQQPIITEPIIGRVTGLPLITIAVPIFNQAGEMVGILAGNINLSLPNFLSEVIQYSYGKSGSYMVIDRHSGLTLASRNPSPVLKHFREFPQADILTRFLNREEGTLIGVGQSGSKELFSSRSLQSTDWFVVVNLPVEEAFSPAYRLRFFFFVVAVFLSVIGAILAMALLRYQLMPLTSAARTLGAMSDGSVPRQPFPILHDDEVGKVLQAFNQLLNTVELQQSRLESRVEDEVAQRIQQEKLLGAIFGATTIGLCVMDNHWNYIKVNRAYCEITGYSEEELQGRCALERMLSHSSFMEILQKELGHDRQHTQGEFQVGRKDSSFLTVIASFRQIHTLNNQLLLVLSLTDITELIHLRHKQELQQALLLQQSKMAEIGSMLGAIVHQWKQPLNAIAITAQMIPEVLQQESVSREDVSELVESILTQTSFMSQTAEDFRSFFKPSTQLMVFEVGECIQSVLYLMKGTLIKNHINLTLDHPESLYVTGFTNEFKQVIMNVLSNARDAFLLGSIQGAKITISTRQVDDTAIITIMDNAGGISPELLPDKLFHPFTSTKGTEGTGIGLSLSRKIIIKMGGSIQARNFEDGACFTIGLPVNKGKYYDT